MGSASRVLLSLFFSSTPSLSATQLRFKSVAPHSPARVFHMYFASSSSPPPSSSVSTNPPPPSSAAHGGAPSASFAIDFLSICHRLKTTKRAGWIRKGVEDPESIADHMYRMSLMALIAADIPGVDRDRCVKMAIVHDIAEAIVGDITPSDGISKEEKSRREQEALDHMCKVLGGGPRGGDDPSSLGI